jgi:hypothetical protein
VRVMRVHGLTNFDPGDRLPLATGKNVLVVTAALSSAVTQMCIEYRNLRYTAYECISLLERYARKETAEPASTQADIKRSVLDLATKPVAVRTKPVAVLGSTPGLQFDRSLSCVQGAESVRLRQRRLRLTTCKRRSRQRRGVWQRRVRAPVRRRPPGERC